MNNKINLICNKCGTPIIHGEGHCRFCGSSDFSEKEYVKKYEDVEIIGFEEAEIIDFTTGEDDVTIPSSNEGSTETPVAPVQPVVPAAPVPASAPAPAVEESKAPEVAPITDAPLEATGVLKKVEMPKNDLNDVVTFTSQNKPEERSVVSEATPYIVTSPSAKVKEEVVDEMSKTLAEEGINLPLDAIDISRPEGKSGHVVAIIFLSFLLFVSILGNIYLAAASPATEENKEDKNVISEVTKSLYLGNYKMEVPNNWNTYTKDNFLVLTSDSDVWAASFNVKADLTNNGVSKKADTLREEFGKNKYSFSSVENPSETETVFKGKYNNKYVTYVITRELDNDSVAIIDLKFKGAVDEKIYTAVVKALDSVVKADAASLYKNDFEFNDVSKLIGDVLVK